MRMKKPELEIIRFESEDVIATSAQPTARFKFSGFFDGIEGNLQMIFNGEDKTGKGAEVLSYLTKNYGSFDWIGFEETETGSSYKLDIPAFPGYFSTNSWADNDNDGDMLFLNNYEFNYERIDSESHLTIWFKSTN